MASCWHMVQLRHTSLGTMTTEIQVASGRYLARRVTRRISLFTSRRPAGRVSHRTSARCSQSRMGCSRRR
eukprot:15441989-Alexandrium_andersonii.AAC.1